MHFQIIKILVGRTSTTGKSNNKKRKTNKVNNKVLEGPEFL